jgi:serine/threonine-protein kinase
VTLQQGDLVAGKYRIDRLVGRGGMGTVVAATNVLLGQRVALKFLLPELLGETSVVERFLREARASARLTSEHVCRVFDVGNEAGAPFIVMELLDGRDLGSLVTPGVPWPVAITTDYLLQACVGLAEAHAIGIVHRDLKPVNLFLTHRLDGTALIKVLDFGIAKPPTDMQVSLTRTATVIGSPGYMSPEQLRSSRDTDRRTDIWALGVILYELTAGRQPFVSDSITELALRVAGDPMPPLPGVPREFERVVARCLEKDPKRRFADVGQLAAALAPFGSARAREVAAGIANLLRRAVASPPVASAAVAPSTSTTLSSSVSTLPSAAVPRARWSLGMAAAVTLVASFAVVALGRRAPGATSAPVRRPAATLVTAIDAGMPVIAADAAPVAPPEPAQVVVAPVPEPPAVAKKIAPTVKPAGVRKKPAPIAAPAEAAKPPPVEAAKSAPTDVGASRE